MKFTQTFIPTLREAPRDAEIISHKLLFRAGLIRKLSSGIYSYLPLGLRSIQKISNIIREGMSKWGAQEVLLPLVIQKELWEESGRWSAYGKELLRFKDRHEKWFTIGPTHEEVIVDLVRNDVKSYKQLPVNLYQIGPKFRDEIRPRFGLMRGREFIMKDGYSFDMDEEHANITYQQMYDAYNWIFKQCGLKFRAVEADTGTIGGKFSHEFMVLASTGEEAIVFCDACGYAANMEKAEIGYPDVSDPTINADNPLPELVSTPGRHTVAEVSEFLKVSPTNILKTMIIKADDTYVAAIVRGDRELNLIKLKNVMNVDTVELAADEDCVRLTRAHAGSIGPIGLKLKIIADNEIKYMQNMVAGANKDDFHYINVNLKRDFMPDVFADIRNAVIGDPCPRCLKPLNITRGIEVGHIFKLGTKYSAKMHAEFLDENGNSKPFVMGCYGIGVGRTLAASIEQNNDKDGIIFPITIAPYEIELIAINMKDTVITNAAETLYKELLNRGFDVIYDNRDISPGMKLKDADLIGFPVKIIVGTKFRDNGTVEIKIRKTGEVITCTQQTLFDNLVKIRNSLLP
ncbi:MAG: proline--tRNA ligase [bacterium]